jgi:hypothetical protein
MSHGMGTTGTIACACGFDCFGALFGSVLSNRYACGSKVGAAASTCYQPSVGLLWVRITTMGVWATCNSASARSVSEHSATP